MNSKQPLATSQQRQCSTKNILLALMASLFVASTAPAQIIFSNYSDNPAATNYAYLGGVAGAVGFPLEWNQDVVDYYPVRWAMPFVNNTGADQPLGTVSLAMYKNPDGTPPNLTIRLVKDNGHGLPSSAPGDILEVLAVDPVIPEDSESFLNLTSVAHPLLLAGATNWITAETTRYDTNSAAQDVLYYWIQNNSGSKFSYTCNPYGQYSGWLGYYNQPDPPNRFPAPTLRVTAVVPVMPALSITLQSGTAVLQWSTNNATGFRLETQGTLESSWSPVSDTPQLNGTFWQVMQPLDSAAKFYRLTNP